MKIIFFKLGCALFLSLVSSQGLAQTPASSPTSKTSAPPAAASSSSEIPDWKLIKQKKFPHYRVEILQRMTPGKSPRVEATKARIIPNAGGSVVEHRSVLLTPNPREFIKDWKGGLLDLDGDGLEDLILQSFSGGGHCCFQYNIYSLGQTLKKIGDLPMRDCGDKIELTDLNGDKKPEIISCDASFVYIGDRSFAEGPFPKAVYTLGAKGYERADSKFRAVLDQDIQNYRKILELGEDPSAVLQITTDYLLLGETQKAWEEFDKNYQESDKEQVRTELQQRLKGEAAPIDKAIPGSSPNPTLNSSASGNF